MRVVPCAVLGFLGLLVPVSALARQDETVSRSTRIVTAADGTRTTTITEKVTRNGRTTTTTRKIVTAPGEDAEKTAPPEWPPPPTPPTPPTPERAPAVSDARAAADLPAEALAAHNRERRSHGVGELSWDPGLAKLAQAWASHLCRDGRRGSAPPMLQHRPQTSSGPGENLWEGMTTEATTFPIGDAVKSWVAEKAHYSERTGRCQGGVCGHYTQLVWRASQKVGCGVAVCPAGAFTATIWACNYSPAGNVEGERPY